MPREKDPFWRYVTLLDKNNSKWRCNFCGQVTSGGATRIKAHLAGIARFGIKGCEGVDVDVKAEAREVLMPKNVMDSSDQGVPKERIEGNVRVAPTSTSDPPYVEGGTNLQSAQGAPPLTPQTHGLIEGLVQAEGEVHIVNLPWAGATSYPSASPPPELFFFTPHELSTLFTESVGLKTLNALQNPCAPSPSQHRQLLDNTFQKESQGSVLLASDTQLTPTATIYTPRQSNQSHQSFHRQGGHGTGVSPPRESMDIEPLFSSQPFNEPLISEPFNSPPQIPGDIIDTMSPSTSEGVPPSTPQSRTDQRVQEDRLVDIASLLLDGATSSSSASPRLNSFPPDSPNELSPNISQSLTLDAQRNRTAPFPSQNRPLLTNTSQNESQGSILPGPIESNTQLTNMATTNAPQHSNQTHQSFHRQCGCGTGLSPPRDSMDIQLPIPSQLGPPIIEPWNSPPQIPEDIINTTGPSTLEVMPKGAPAGASSFQYDQLLGVGNSNLDCNRPRISSVTSVTNTLPYSNQPLPSCNEECGTETSSFPLRDSRGIGPVTAIQPTRCPHIEATHVNLQVLEDGTNMASPSPSQVQPTLVPHQHQSVPHQFISPQTRNAQQNPTGLSSSQKNPTVAGHLQAPMNMDPCILSLAKDQNNAPPPPQILRCVTDLIGPSSLPEIDMNKGEPLTSHTNTDNNFDKSGALKRKIKRLYCREADIKEELEFATSISLKKPRMEVKNWLAEVEKLRNDFHSIEATSENCLPPHQQIDILMQETEDLMEQGKFTKGLFLAREAKFNELLERKLVGEAFQRNTTNILEHLVGNQISRLGIYGMGGVGKTTLMVHIHNRLLTKANYGKVLWITVSQDFNTQKLQEDIWKALGLGRLSEKDVRKRAAMLSDGLTKEEKLIIILDDVWEHFYLEEVGIPIRANGLKLVITTRSFDVCRQMHCQEKIKIEPLSQEEAESLFFEELGSKVDLNWEIEAVVKSIVKECAGLPLGVITMAASMQEVTDVFEWKDCLVKLKESDLGQTDMEKKVLMNLKFSYDRLGNHEVQQCFLSCALYPEDKSVRKIELIEFFIDQGLIGGLNTREKQYDRGLTILNKLENVCLLEDCKQNDRMKMHDLIRDMALHIMSATSIVKARKQLMRIPSEEYWTNALEKVSLMMNNIRELPLNMSPNCPKLSILLLNDGLWDVVIPNSFFKKLQGLKVLNLSGCNVTKLPKSISKLVNLRALLLGKCTNLRRIPYLGKLTSLRKLDARGCKNLEALKGLEKLVNLRYLDLTQTRIKSLPEGTLDCLLNLQYLRVSVVNEEDIKKFGALETFGCNLENADGFNKCVRVIEQSNNPRYYNLKVHQESWFTVKVSDDARFQDLWGSDDARFPNLTGSVYIWKWCHAIVSMGGECTGIFILIPRDVRALTGRNCHGITNLSSMGPLEYLESLNIGKCENLGVLCGGHDEEVIDIHYSPTLTPIPILFSKLKFISIMDCPKLKYLFGHGFKSNLPHLQNIHIFSCKEMLRIIASITSPPPPHSPPAFPSLVHIFVSRCDKMKRVVESEWMPHFPNLRDVSIYNCENMEEIIGGPPPYVPVEEISLSGLAVHNCSNMRKLFSHEWLPHLQKLQYINVESCKGMVEMTSGAGQGQEGSIMTLVHNPPSSFQPPISLPKLRHLRLYNLPQLKSICGVPISCDSMEKLGVHKCPELKGIPLQLRLRETEELPFIWVEDEEKWKTLMWDHLDDTLAILQPYLQKGEHAELDNHVFSLWGKWCSPNAIELFGEKRISRDSALE